MIDSPHVTYTADMFGNSSELWARNYVLGLFRSANGIEGLRTSDINPRRGTNQRAPFHQKYACGKRSRG